MKCSFHPKKDAVAACRVCNKSLCKDCAIVVAGEVFCPVCRAFLSVPRS
jgi:hypothetical protein